MVWIFFFLSIEITHLEGNIIPNPESHIVPPLGRITVIAFSGIFILCTVNQCISPRFNFHAFFSWGGSTWASKFPAGCTTSSHNIHYRAHWPLQHTVHCLSCRSHTPWLPETCFQCQCVSSGSIWRSGSTWAPVFRPRSWFASCSSHCNIKHRIFLSIFPNYVKFSTAWFGAFFKGLQQTVWEVIPAVRQQVQLAVRVPRLTVVSSRQFYRTQHGDYKLVAGRVIVQLNLGGKQASDLYAHSQIGLLMSVIKIRAKCFKAGQVNQLS